MKKLLPIWICLLALLMAGCALQDAGDVIEMWQDVRSKTFVEPERTADDNSLGYHRQAMTDAQDQALYDTFLKAFQAGTPELAFKKDALSGHQDQLDQYYRLVWNDHPELLNVPYQRKDGYQAVRYHFLLPPRNTVIVSLNYNDEKEALAQIEANTAQFVAETKALTTNRDKAKACYDYVCQNVTYDEKELDQSMKSAALNGRGVCSGYARFYQYLLQQVGVPAGYVHVTINKPRPGEVSDHAVCLIYLDDNQWYASDVTWGDQPTYNNLGMASDPTYFAMNTAEFDHYYTLADEIATGTYEMQMPDMPSDAMSDFVYHQRIAENEAELLAIIERDAPQGEPFLVKISESLKKSLADENSMELPVSGSLYLSKEQNQVLMIPV